MSKINDGGPAFPNEYPIGAQSSGMSLRDYFAGQALIGIAATMPQMEKGRNPIAIAELCYAFADAMLAAREKGGAS